MQKDKDPQAKTGSTLERALFLLEYLAFQEAKMGVRELADSVQLPKSTTHRILDVLLKAGYVEQDPITEKYAIGLKAIEIGMAGLKKADLVEASISQLKELASLTTQTAFLAVCHDDEIVYLYKAEGTSSVITNANLGTRNPMHCTGLGKAMLAHLPLADVERIMAVKGLERYTDTTITDPQRLLQELSDIREAGFAFNHQEYDEGLSSLASPVFDYTGCAIAAISVAGPTNRIIQNKEKIAIGLKEKSAAISKKLGFVLL